MKPLPIESEEQLEKDLENRVGLVSFCVPWSAPCLQQQRILNRLAKAFEGRARIGVMNVEENEGVARSYGIRSVPTLVIFRNRKEIQRFTGLQSGSVLMEALEGLLVKSR
ncbi:MAG: thioredoxin family protein [Desulfobacteraceae bacterium]|jgi:thioredoxin 1